MAIISLDFKPKACSCWSLFIHMSCNTFTSVQPSVAIRFCQVNCWVQMSDFDCYGNCLSLLMYDNYGVDRPEIDFAPQCSVPYNNIIEYIVVFDKLIKYTRVAK